MRIYREDAPISMALAKVEALMQKLNLSISWEPNGLRVIHNEIEADIVDLDSRDTPVNLPRMVDSERLEAID